ncbi:hemolysin XhlA family protein [Bacillus sp. N13C7]|nr:hemolysin XhlA family protein [Bacillus sp. S20C3]MCY8290273.1 hemolysin XhlA family protein [Bacillus sp. N13C7]MCY8638751.1 hemolysin XhlA family protein [Bacillus sp. S17B2]MCY9144779.1 hemolysin XhlA family protein [Bacillus sp. T9C1]
MSEVTEVPDLHALQKEIMEMKAGQKTIEQRVNVLERVSDRQDQQIMTLNEKLNKIEENTTWIKRTITGAIITAVCTGVIGGAIAIFYTVLQK